MAATISSFDSILKEFYVGPVTDQVNNEVLALEMFEKATVSWNGKNAILPLHTDRNSGTGFRAEGGTLPTAGNQGFVELNVTAKYLYGRFQISGPAIAAAKTGGAGAFISYAEAEMDMLVNDVRNAANSACFTGGLVCGFITYAGAGGVGVVTAPYSGAAYSGDAVLLNMNTGEYVVSGGASTATLGAATNVTVVATTSALGIAAGYPDMTAGSASAGDVLAVVKVSGGALAPGDESTGIFTHLGGPTVHGLDKVDAISGAGQSPADLLPVYSMDGVATGVFQALTLERMQEILDIVYNQSGETPDVILTNPLQRAKYSALLIGTAAAILQGGNGGREGDGGLTGWSFAGIPVRASKDAPNGSWVFLSKKYWKLLELQKPGFADLDGSVMSRVANTDAFEGFFRLYYDVACTRFNANAILTGCEV